MVSEFSLSFSSSHFESQEGWHKWLLPKCTEFLQPWGPEVENPKSGTWVSNPCFRPQVANVQ